MKEIRVTINENGKASANNKIIGYSGENEVTEIILIPDSALTNYDFYIEFLTVGKEPIITPKLDNNLKYTVPNSVLTDAGNMGMQIIIRNSDVVMKTNIINLYVSPSINASNLIKAKLIDFIAKANEILEKVKNTFVQPDLNQNNETAADYVKNRTHYIEYGETEEITAQELGLSLGNSNNADTYLFEINGTTYTDYSITYESSDVVKRYPIVTVDGYVIKVDKAGMSSPVYTPSDAAWVIYKRSIISVKQLDEQFIPDTIARISEIPTTDNTVTATGANPVSGAAVAEYVAANAGGEFRLLSRITISEEVASVIITADEEGNPLSCVELALQAYLVPNTAADGKIVEVCGYVDGNTAKDYWFGYMGAAPKSGESISRAEINIRTGKSQKTYTTNLVPFNSTQMTNYSGQSELNALQNHSSVAWAYAPITENSFITGIIIKGGSGSMLGVGCEFVIFGR